MKINCTKEDVIAFIFLIHLEYVQQMELWTINKSGGAGSQVDWSKTFVEPHKPTLYHYLNSDLTAL